VYDKAFRPLYVRSEPCWADVFKCRDIEGVMEIPLQALAKALERHAGMPTRPSGFDLPSSQATTSAKVRWMSMPITRLNPPPLVKSRERGATRHLRIRALSDRASRRGGQLLTRALGSSNLSACPHFVLPVPLSRMLAPYARTAGSGRTDQHHPPSYGLLSRSNASGRFIRTCGAGEMVLP
jgi:hypothetical protein